MAALRGEFTDREILQFIQLDRLVRQRRAEDCPGRIDDNAAHPVSGCCELDQIIYAPPNDPLLVLRRRLSRLEIVQQQPRGDFPLCAAAVLKYQSKSLAGISANRCARCESFRVMPRSSRVGNPFRSGTGLGRPPELRGYWPSLRSAREPEFCASVLCGHAESRPLSVPPQGFRRVSEAHAAVVGAEIPPNLVAHLANPLIFHPSALNETGETGLARKPRRSEPSVAMAEATVATGTKCIAKIWV
jgi:hypothetical protein